MIKIKAVILAAGRGVRLRPLTFDTPKPLLKINNKPILEHNLDQLIRLVDEVIIIVGYKAEMIKEYFGNQYKGIKITYIIQEKQLGTAHALLQAKGRLQGRFIVMNGDDLYNKYDIENCLKKEIAILAKVVGDPSRFGVLVVEGGLVTDIIEKSPNPPSKLANTGLYVLNDDIFSLLEDVELSERGEYELTDAIKELIIVEDVEYVPVKKYWISISNIKEIEMAEKELKKYEGSEK